MNKFGANDSLSLLAWRILIVALICLMAPVGVVATPGLVPLLAAAALAAVALTGFRLVLRGRQPPQILAILALFTLWATASTLWAPHAYVAGQAAFKIVGICLVGLLLVRAIQILEPDERGQMEKALIIGWLLGLAVLATGYTYASLTEKALWGQYVGDPLTTLSRGEVVLLMMAWPTASVLWQRKKSFVLAAVLVTLAISLLLLRSHAALVGLSAGVAVFSVVFLFKRQGLILVACAAATLAVATPALVSLLPSGDTLFRKVGFVVPSAVHRAYTWHFTADRIFEHPIRGWGMGSSRRIPGGDAIIVPATKDLRDPLAPPWQETPGQSLMNRSEYMPLHPHSVPLQVWLELGVPGALLMGWLVLVVFLGPARGRTVGFPYAFRAGAATSYLVVGGLSFGAWQNWWIALGWLTAALMSMAASDEAPIEKSSVSQSA